MKKPKYYWQTVDLNSLSYELMQNNIFITSTDTVLGLLAQANEYNMQQLSTIKQRSSDVHKAYVVLIGSFNQIADFVSIDYHAKVFDFVQQHWPAPLTVIASAHARIASWGTAQHTIALRMPTHPQLQVLAKLVNGLFSTSANIAGKPVPTRVSDIDSSIIEQSCRIIIDQAVEEYPIIPSTIVDITVHPYQIIRQGVYYL